jgi:hypothetical protein
VAFGIQPAKAFFRKLLAGETALRQLRESACVPFREMCKFNFQGRHMLEERDANTTAFRSCRYPEV